MEGAVRVFAVEFSKSTLSVPAEDEKSAAWVVTPSGASCRQVFLAGALVEVQEQAGMLTARVADPTGGYDLVCSGNTPVLTESICRIPLPSFVSVSGRAQLFRKGGKTVLSIRPDQVQVIDRRTRDQWIITTAAATLARLEMMHHALEGTCNDSRVRQACAYYSLTRKDLGELAALVAGALASVRPLQVQESIEKIDPSKKIMEYIRSNGSPRGIAVEDILDMAGSWAVSREAVLSALESLIVEDECYQPQKGFVKPL